MHMGRESRETQLRSLPRAGRTLSVPHLKSTRAHLSRAARSSAARAGLLLREVDPLEGGADAHHHAERQRPMPSPRHHEHPLPAVEGTSQSTPALGRSRESFPSHRLDLFSDQSQLSRWFCVPVPPGCSGGRHDRWPFYFQVKLPPQTEVITSEELMAHLGDCLLSIKPQEKSEGLQLNFQQNVDDAMTVLPKLATGLDVNVRFTGVSDFEYTPECSVFDLLGIPLYHGWLVDPQSPEAVSAVGKLSYNQLVEKIITCKLSSDPNLVTEGLIAEQFLENTAAQLTYHGLCELTAAAREGELSVFFRNNHFSTMTKHESHLYLLVTDQGFLQEEQVVWESLHNVDGDSCFCDSDFRLSHSLGKAPGAEGGKDAPEKQLQVDQDYLIALSLQQQQPQGTLGLTDLELAQRLQQEEYQQQQGMQPVQARAPLPQVLDDQSLNPMQERGATSGRPAGDRRQRPKHQSDCILL
ncbi:Protein FAM63A [Fukomys damarensis]|uniref:Ubiquitin carboxyl-terminal hydrolase n=1 Tax=Fukomys damarensis TaxID=885580 RepID=A0A091CLJ7_FUKDA|nr:Protein FAM63A [Fukomys damarensis]